MTARGKIELCPVCKGDPKPSSPGNKLPSVECECGRRAFADSLCEAVERWNNAAEPMDMVLPCPNCGNVPQMESKTTFDGADVRFLCCGITGAWHPEKYASNARRGWNAGAEYEAERRGISVKRTEGEAPQGLSEDDEPVGMHDRLQAIADAAGAILDCYAAGDGLMKPDELIAAMVAAGLMPSFGRVGVDMLCTMKRELDETRKRHAAKLATMTTCEGCEPLADMEDARKTVAELGRQLNRVTRERDDFREQLESAIAERRVSLEERDAWRDRLWEVSHALGVPGMPSASDVVAKAKDVTDELSNTIATLGVSRAVVDDVREALKVHPGIDVVEAAKQVMISLSNWQDKADEASRSVNALEKTVEAYRNGEELKTLRRRIDDVEDDRAQMKRKQDATYDKNTSLEETVAMLKRERDRSLDAEKYLREERRVAVVALRKFREQIGKLLQESDV